MASEDYVKVMVDYNLASKKRKSKVDTGKFENIYDAKVEAANPGDRREDQGFPCP